MISQDEYENLAAQHKRFLEKQFDSLFDQQLQQIANEQQERIIKKLRDKDWITSEQGWVETEIPKLTLKQRLKNMWNHIEDLFCQMRSEYDDYEIHEELENFGNQQTTRTDHEN